ncbi:hypothetical protein E2562_014251 [Oryza meyeriana var. granulata]|uniref:DUF6598 domain-containing protein n=1 Tax=Oryza meyeriana var. granulata TaxID=110450 RepID=A0A6G1BKG6_9ORYZ|nr:hypothetical protein E2562_014251 [Oryza meyeriana var. granulata]
MMKNTTLEFMFAHLRSAVAATVTVRVVEGLPDFKAHFTARTAVALTRICNSKNGLNLGKEQF